MYAVFIYSVENVVKRIRSNTVRILFIYPALIQGNSLSLVLSNVSSQWECHIIGAEGDIEMMLCLVMS